MALLRHRLPGACGWVRALLVAALLVAALLGSGAARLPAASPTAPSAEYQLKAVFLFNFAQFVGWPENSFSSPEAPLVIGILGPDPFGDYLDDVVRGEHVGGRALVVRRFARVTDIPACHILFVSPGLDDQLARIVPAGQEGCWLTVGESENFNRTGGIVRFVTEKGKIRLRINMESARKSKLTLSSKLLRWAIIVDSADKR